MKAANCQKTVIKGNDRRKANGGTDRRMYENTGASARKGGRKNHNWEEQNLDSSPSGAPSITMSSNIRD